MWFLCTCCCCLCCLDCTNHICGMNEETIRFKYNWSMLVWKGILYVLRAKSFQMNSFYHDENSDLVSSLFQHFQHLYGMLLWTPLGIAILNIHIYSHEHTKLLGPTSGVGKQCSSRLFSTLSGFWQTKPDWLQQGCESQSKPQ